MNFIGVETAGIVNDSEHSGDRFQLFEEFDGRRVKATGVFCGD